MASSSWRTILVMLVEFANGRGVTGSSQEEVAAVFGSRLMR